MSPVHSLFATPVMHTERLLDAALVDALVSRFSADADRANARSAGLSHTELLVPGADALLAQAGRLIAPRLIEFGTLLFGAPLPWAIKEMWVNVLDTGGRQALHNHANSFVSGVVYLTASHASAHTVFARPLGGGFVFSHANRDTRPGPFNADKWVTPAVAPGDLLLFPSHLLHEVPPNEGGRRISLAFNAIPQRLDAWGYAIGFGA